MPHLSNRYDLPDPMNDVSAPRGSRATVTRRKGKGSSAVSPSEFLTGLNENREEGQDEFTRDNLPPGFSINRGSRDSQRETVSFESPRRPHANPIPDAPVPPTPSNSAAELDEAAGEQRKRQSRLRGRASTILTGNQGLLSDPNPNSLRIRTLMGA